MFSYTMNSFLVSAFFSTFCYIPLPHLELP